MSEVRFSKQNEAKAILDRRVKRGDNGFMNFIVLLKQVPDVSRIPPEAWDHQKGTLKRAVLDVVLNPLDLHALTMACRMRGQMAQPGAKIIALTMGPPFAVDVIIDAISRGADQGVLLTDPHFAGADTVSTAFSLAAAIRKIEKEFFRDQKDYIVVCGVQSTDGDTAQVPPQIAEELGCDLIAYVEGFSLKPSCSFSRIGPASREEVFPQKFPVVITVTDCLEPVYPSFSRMRLACMTKGVYVTWTAEDIQADKKRIGFEGSMTQVVNIYSPEQDNPEGCVFVGDGEALFEKITERLAKGAAPKKETASSAYEWRGQAPSRQGEIWVFAEVSEGALAPVTLELLGKAREIAGVLKVPVGALLLGQDVKKLSAVLLAHGADKIYLQDHPQLKNFESSSYTRILAHWVQERSPQILLFGATPLGRELAPRVSYATKAGLTADCTKLTIGDYKDHPAVLLQTRPALGGNIMATIVTRLPGVQMATVRPGVFAYPVPDPTRQGEVVECSPSIPPRTVMIESVEILERQQKLSEAKVIVAGGAGLRSADNFDKYIIPLAKALAQHFQLNVGVGASRRAVEMGIVERAHQVGQTGQTVQPDVYFAIGISGAIQHISGMQKSSIIVAINPDPSAPIFKQADFGIIGRSEQIVPQLLGRLNPKQEARDG